MLSPISRAAAMMLSPIPRAAVLMMAAIALASPACRALDASAPPGEPLPDAPAHPDEPQRGDAAIAPAPGGLRRLLRRQYLGAVRVLLGPAAAEAASPPEDTALHGLDAIAAAELALAPSAVDAYEASARAVARVAARDPETVARILPCAPRGPADATCHRQFVASFGRLAFRRPLNRAEIERFTGLAQRAAAAYADFNAGLEHAISAFLQSPSFLYLVELGEPDPDHPAARRLSTHELLARLSFFLLDQPPDAALLAAAGGRELTAADVRALARQMLRRPEAKAALASFYSELLQIRGLEHLSRDRERFPRWSPALAGAMKEEVLRVLDDVIWTRDADARELLTGDATFVDAELAALYGVPPPGGPGFVKIVLPAAQERSGLLTAPAILARYAHADRTSPTRRGLFVRATLLCEDVPPPPPGSETALPRASAPMPLAARLEQHMSDPSCRGCHALTDPVGLALERYDATGAYRAEDDGSPIEPAAADVAGLGAFAGARELGALLRDDPRASRCMVEHLLRGALGRTGRDVDGAAIDALDEAFAASGYRVRELLVELVASPAFRLVGAPR